MSTEELAPERAGIAVRLIGHEGFVWHRATGGWTCRCGAQLTAAGEPARPEDAKDPWREHIADLLSRPPGVES